MVKFYDTTLPQSPELLLIRLDTERLVEAACRHKVGGVLNHGSNLDVVDETPLVLISNLSSTR
jgi:hypothetical protein